MNSKFSMIDLFAGCGGLSLGFEQQGFEPLLFSEINRNAAQTYLKNRKNLEIASYGDVYTLTNENLELLMEQWSLKGIDDIDVIAGGPPCQGYSGIGHRRTFKLDKNEIPSNHLYQEMVRIIECIKPKVFLFENVKGLLSGRWTKEGVKGEIFEEVLDAFKSIKGYECDWELLHAKDYGVPQNRPRTIIIGYRRDIWEKYQQPDLFKTDIIQEDVSPYMKGGDAIKRNFLPEKQKKSPPSLSDSLDDLIDNGYEQGGATKFYPNSASTNIQRYFRTNKAGKVSKKGDLITEHEYSKHSQKVLDKFKYMLENNGEVQESMKTKKFAQRLLPKTWGKLGPNITATSLPDDYVHYFQPRVPTVREWARIQTFPDWYEFCGPRTTGGRRRAGDPSAGIWDREVPKYTQIGNAVPVKLASAIASHIKLILGSN